MAKTGKDGDWLELYVDNSSEAVIDLLKLYVQLDHPAKGAWEAAEKQFPNPCNERRVSSEIRR